MKIEIFDFFHPTEPKVENKLDIFGKEKKVAEESCRVGPVQTFPGSKTVKLFPAVFADEKESVVYFTSELANYFSELEDSNTAETEKMVKWLL